MTPDNGEIQVAREVTIGYLPQQAAGLGKGTLFQQVRGALDELSRMEAELARLEKEISNSQEARVLERYSFLQENFRLRGGYSMEADVARVLDGLGFAKNDWEKSCETFSGGWQMRIALAKLLLQRPNLLLLDEPTNHLDLPTRDWLENYLREYPFSVVLVSHDRFFLDQTVEKIVEIWNGGIHEYSGNYSHYLVEREQRISQICYAKQRQDEEIQKIQIFINRFRYQANKASLVQSRVKQLERIERIEVPPLPKKVAFQFPPSSKSGKTVLEMKGIGHGYGFLTVFEDVDLTVSRGERIALVGANGAGKSTLMRLISGRELPLEGTRQEGHNLSIGYFAQNQASQLDSSRTVLEEITADAPFEMVPKLRNILGAFLFSSDEVEKKVSVLSGGEKNRLALAKLLLIPCNLLLLDEPTNHLDLESKDVLLEALKKYDGTMIFVSHDRYFVDHLASRILEIGDGKVVSHLGNYEDFLKRKEKEGGSGHSTLRVEQRDGTLKNVDDEEKNSRKNDHLERKARQREERRRQKEITSLEERIMVLETEVSDLEKFLAEPASYENENSYKEAILRYDHLRKEVEDLYQQWDEALSGQNYS
jgi:ATP-binding cassette subfamily F protein 3